MTTNYKIYDYNIGVVGLSSGFVNNQQVKVGKSYFCNRYIHPAKDDLIKAHYSIYSPLIVNNKVINNDNFLYWGSKSSLFLEIQSEDLENKNFDSVNFSSLPQKEIIFVNHNLFEFTFLRTTKQTNLFYNYVEYCTQSKYSSPGKLCYISPSQVNNMHKYERIECPNSQEFIFNGYIFVIDTSENITFMNEQIDCFFSFYKALLNIQQKHNRKIPIVIAFSKFDESFQTTHYENMKNFIKDNKIKVAICETSALLNVNIEETIDCILSLIHYQKHQKTILKLKNNCLRFEKTRIFKRESEENSLLDNLPLEIECSISSLSNIGTNPIHNNVTLFSNNSSKSGIDNVYYKEKCASCIVDNENTSKCFFVNTGKGGNGNDVFKVCESFTTLNGDDVINIKPYRTAFIEISQFYSSRMSKFTAIINKEENNFKSFDDWIVYMENRICKTVELVKKEELISEIEVYQQSVYFFGKEYLKKVFEEVVVKNYESLEFWLREIYLEEFRKVLKTKFSDLNSLFICSWNWEKCTKLLKTMPDFKQHFTTLSKNQKWNSSSRLNTFIYLYMVHDSFLKFFKFKVPFDFLNMYYCKVEFEKYIFELTNKDRNEMLSTQLEEQLVLLIKEGSFKVGYNVEEVAFKLLFKGYDTLSQALMEYEFSGLFKKYSDMLREKARIDFTELLLEKSAEINQLLHGNFTLSEVKAVAQKDPRYQMLEARMSHERDGWVINHLASKGPNTICFMVNKNNCVDSKLLSIKKRYFNDSVMPLEEKSIINIHLYCEKSAFEKIYFFMLDSCCNDTTMISRYKEFYSVVCKKDFFVSPILDYKFKNKMIASEENVGGKLLTIKIRLFYFDFKWANLKHYEQNKMLKSFNNVLVCLGKDNASLKDIDYQLKSLENVISYDFSEEQMELVFFRTFNMTCLCVYSEKNLNTSLSEYTSEIKTKSSMAETDSIDLENQKNLKEIKKKFESYMFPTVVKSDIEVEQLFEVIIRENLFSLEVENDTCIFRETIHINVCLMCGDDYPIEFILRMFTFGRPYRYNLDDNTFSFIFKPENQEKDYLYMLHFTSYHTLYQVNNVHGFALVCSSKRRASLEMMRSIMIENPNIPFHIVCIITTCIVLPEEINCNVYQSTHISSAGGIHLFSEENISASLLDSYKKLNRFLNFCYYKKKNILLIPKQVVVSSTPTGFDKRSSKLASIKSSKQRKIIKATEVFDNQSSINNATSRKKSFGQSNTRCTSKGGIDSEVEKRDDGNEFTSSSINFEMKSLTFSKYQHLRRDVFDSELNSVETSDDKTDVKSSKNRQKSIDRKFSLLDQPEDKEKLLDVISNGFLDTSNTLKRRNLSSKRSNIPSIIENDVLSVNTEKINLDSISKKEKIGFKNPINKFLSLKFKAPKSRNKYPKGYPNPNKKASSKESTAGLGKLADVTSNKDSNLMNKLDLWNKNLAQRDLQGLQGYLGEESYFLKPLSVLCVEMQTPIFLQKCFDIIESTGLDIEGLYRIGSAKHVIDFLLNEFSKDQNADFSLLNLDNHVYTNGIKQFVKLQTEPLFPEKYITKLIEIMKEESTSTNENVYLLCKNFDEPTFVTFKALMKHLNIVSKNAEKNKMLPNNLSLCWWPTLIRPNINLLSSIGTDVSMFTLFFQKVIEEYEDIFK